MQGYREITYTQYCLVGCQFNVNTYRTQCRIFNHTLYYYKLGNPIIHWINIKHVREARKESDEEFMSRGR